MPIFTSIDQVPDAIWIYLLFINCITFIVYGADKYLAIKTSKSNPRRISEKNLFSITFLGGTLGAISAMILFRHKIKKMEFLIKFFIIALIQAEIIYVLFKG